ncbi:FAD-binding oxidoreductase [Pseudoruegeria sp. SK021]|uniref:FAD-binding oxidoreductase n=1 Tax=Pseudoruegeria sp. SK021 TaxID=1933035 RepID=UPI000A235FB6|nr:FAD-binding oxidoreductase [Pseudoruegeria sp. SK021]OSP55964.1 hypothetical protein BV911_04770 [Pseudoruegeria sp. SK021]
MTALDDLSRILGAAHVLSDPKDVAPYLTDWTGDYRSESCLVLRPGSTDEVAAVMVYCHRAGLQVIPQGGNTGLVGGAVASDAVRCVILNLGRMTRIRQIDAANHTLAADAGCIVQTLCDAAAAQDRLFPLSFGAMGSAQIGGAVSTNAGGLNVLRFGMVRDLVLGLEVVLVDGQVLNLMSGLRKDNRGIDLKQMFIAAEGTLGIITGVTVKLFPQHTSEETAFVALRDLDAAIALFGQARAHCADLLTAFELIPQACIDLGLAYQSDLRAPLAERHDYYVLLKLSCSGPIDLRELTEQFIASAMEEGLVVDGTLASNGQQSAAMWAIREALVLAQAPVERHLRTDVSVRVADIPAFIRAADAAMADAAPEWKRLAYGHIGDGNVHYNMLPPETLAIDGRCRMIPVLLNRLYDVLDGFDGSLSAEHGIGRTRRQAYRDHADPAVLALSAAIKALMDPDGTLNPGSLFLSAQDAPR